MKKTIPTKISNRIVVLCCSLFIFACGQEDPKEITNTVAVPLDTLYIATDSSQAQMLHTLIQVYEGLNPYQKIIPLYDRERALYHYLQDNRVDLILRSYQPTVKEAETFKRRKLNPKINLVWHDALALIAHKEANITTITEQELQLALQQKGTWRVVLDGANTSAYDVLCENYFPNPKMLKAYGAGNENAVMTQVMKDKNYLGLVSSVYFSGYQYDTSITNTLKPIGIVTPKHTQAQYPFQDQIYNQDYPLSRSIYCINIGALNSFGSAFAAFMLSERGQRIILKAGLLPATIPPRTIEIN